MKIRRHPPTHTAAGDALVRTFAAAVGNAYLPSESLPMPNHGGSRPGAGRPARTDAPSRNVTVRFAESEIAEVTAALRDGERVSDFVRDASVREARRRTRKTP